MVCGILKVAKTSVFSADVSNSRPDADEVISVKFLGNKQIQSRLE